MMSYRMDKHTKSINYIIYQYIKSNKLNYEVIEWNYKIKIIIDKLDIGYLFTTLGLFNFLVIYID